MKPIILACLIAGIASPSLAGPGFRALGGWGLGTSEFHSSLVSQSGTNGLPVSTWPGTGLTGAGEVFWDIGGEVVEDETVAAPATKIKPLRVVTSTWQATRQMPGLELVLGVYDLSTRYGAGGWNGANSTYSLATAPVLAGVNLSFPLGHGLRLFSGLQAGYVPASTASFHSETYSGPDSSSPYPLATSDGQVKYDAALGFRGDLAAEYQFGAHLSFYAGLGLLTASLYPSSAFYTQTTKVSGSAAPSSQTVQVSFQDSPSGAGQQWKEGMIIHFSQVAALSGLVWRY